MLSRYNEYTYIFSSLIIFIYLVHIDSAFTSSTTSTNHAANTTHYIKIKVVLLEKKKPKCTKLFTMFIVSRTKYNIININLN